MFGNILEFFPITHNLLSKILIWLRSQMAIFISLISSSLSSFTFTWEAREIQQQIIIPSAAKSWMKKVEKDSLRISKKVRTKKEKKGKEKDYSQSLKKLKRLSKATRISLLILPAIKITNMTKRRIVSWASCIQLCLLLRRYYSKNTLCLITWWRSTKKKIMELKSAKNRKIMLMTNVNLPL